VYLAIDPEGRSVALKVLRPELAATVTAERFLREISMLGQLTHPRIGRVLDSGTADWLVFYVMPYFEGLSMRQVLDERGRLRIDDSIRVARDLLDALAHAHDHGIVHRDLKPDNIILGRDGAVLLDFGIARAIEVAGSSRLTKSGVTLGTTRYMSPEQITADADLDHRSDLYSLGCVLFEAVAGRPPYLHRLDAMILRMHMMEPVPDLGAIVSHAPEEFSRAVTRALQKRREDRWQSAREMLEALGEQTQ
jgi:serine/threonine-protein kinase